MACDFKSALEITFRFRCVRLWRLQRDFAGDAIGKVISCRATCAATKPEARAQTPISLSGGLTCAMISVVAGCALGRK